MLENYSKYVRELFQICHSVNMFLNPPVEQMKKIATFLNGIEDIREKLKLKLLQLNPFPCLSVNLCSSLFILNHPMVLCCLTSVSNYLSSISYGQINNYKGMESRQSN